MVKKLLTFILGLGLAIGASAQMGNNAGHTPPLRPKNIGFQPSDVQFWVGTGSNSAVVVIGWDDDNPGGNFALAWGVHWDGSTTALALVDSIATHDSRLTYSFSGSLMQDIHYADDDVVGGSGYGWCYMLNGSWAPNAYNNQPVADGDLMEVSASCMFSLTTAIAASDPNAVFSCLKAQAVGVTGLTATTATVNITDTTDVNDYTVMLYSGDVLIDSSVIYTQTITYTTLTANTSYTVNVYSNCSDGTQTGSRNASFRTPCVTIAHDELPWTEDFQSGTGSSYATAAAFFSNHVFCWDLINPYNTSDPYINSSSSVNPSGGQCLYVSSRPTSPTILVLPPFEDTPDQLQLSFDVLSSYAHGFEAGIITDVTDASTFTPIALCLPSGSDWNHFEVSFADVTEGRMALRSNDNGPAYLDNVTVAELPSCVKPSQVLVSNVTASSADITITDPNNSNHYMVYYTAEDSAEVFSNSYSLSDLLPNTRYVVRVKTLCDDTTTGFTEKAFRTACGPQAIPYHEDFSQFVDVSSADSTLPCWKFYRSRDLDKLELLSYTSSYGYGEEGLTLRIYGNYSNSIDMLVLPELDQEISTLEISFMARPSETGSFGGNLQVGYVTDADDSSTFVAVANYPSTQFASGYGLCASVFPSAPEGSRIAIRYLPSGGSAKSWYIDDLDVHNMPACVRAQGISVDNITTESFMLHVVDPMNEGAYRCYYTANDVTDSVDFNETDYVVEGLEASTDYTISVVTICDDGSLTLPHTTTVSTLCAPVETLPFVENFEDWVATPSQGMNRCWNRLYMNSSSSLVTNSYPYCATGAANALTGFKSLKMYSKGASNSAIKEYSVAYLPEFENNVTGLKVKFFYKGGSSYNINKVRLAVGISESVNDTTTFTRLATFIPTGTDWVEYEVEFSGYTGTGNRITIMQTSTSSSAFSCYIDSLVVDTVSSCNRPVSLVATEVTASGATLTWVDPSIADSYIVSWSDGTTADSVTVTGETSYALTGLTPSTNYTVNVRSICWGEPTNARSATFVTSCAALPLPWSMNFDNITAMDQLSSCWSRYSGIYDDATSSATLTSTTSGWTRSTTAFDGSSHVKVNLYSTTCKYWLVTPEIDLAEDAELSFDYMLTKYNNTEAPQTGSGLDDDRFVVLATTDGGTTWMPVAKWGGDTERDDYSLASVTNTVSHATLSLADYTGEVVRLAFYGESTVGGTDNDFRIDNIVVAVSDTTTPIIPTPEDATIAASDILYWVGEGANQVVLAVNWADTALAWGYRFSTATVSAQQMMNDIAAADPRFSYTGTSYIEDINYIDTAAGMSDTLGITPGNWWWSLYNHVGGMGLGDVLHNGDFYKWGDMAVAVVTDSTLVGDYMDYTYVWPYTIHPVTVPDTTSEPTDECVPIVLDGNNAFLENFDTIITTGNGVIPACWTSAHIAGSRTELWASYSASTSTCHSGTRMMQLPDMQSGNITLLVAPAFSIATANQYQVSLWVKRTNNYTGKVNEGVKVWANSTPDTVGGTMLFHARRSITQQPAVSSEGWYEYTGVIPLTGTVYIVMEGISEYGAATFIDDFSVLRAPTCDEPADLAYDPATGVVSWTAGNATEWQVRDGETLTVVDAPAYTNPLWQPATTYTVSVRSICGAGDTNAWRNSITFSTPRAACPDTMPVPYSTTFSGYDYNLSPFYGGAPLPDCWTVYSNGSNQPSEGSDASIYYSGIGISTSMNNFGCVTPNDPYFAFIAYAPYDGTYATYITNMNQYGTRKFAVLPRFTMPLNQLDLSFDYSMSARNGAELRIGYIVNDTGDFTPLYVAPTSYRTLAHVDHLDFATLADSIPAGARMTMLWLTTDTVHTGDSPANYFCGIDNLVVNEAVSCKYPRDFVADSVGFHGFSLGWREVSTTPVAQWQVAYGPRGFDPDSDGMLVSVGSTNAVVTGLTSDSEYDAYVRSECGADSYSAWAGPVNIHTFCPDGGNVILGTEEGNDYTVAFANWGNTVCQSVFTAAELAAAGLRAGDSVNNLVYNWHAGTTARFAKAFSIYMTHTAVTAFPETSQASDWLPVAASNLVFSDSLTTTADGLTRYDLATPFVWNGTDGIAITTFVNQPTGVQQTSTGVYAYSSAADSRRTLFARVDRTAYTLDGLASVAPTSSVYRANILIERPCIDTIADTIPVVPEHGPFCGAAGTEGSTAIAADSSVFVAWATGVQLNRGPVTITNPDGPLASFGSETNAIGMPTMNNTMDAVSLGDGGSALVTFAHPIRNDEGPDFAVFENGFNDGSLELAYVEVSSDGERFVRFPANCLTQTETQLPNEGQTDPTNLNNLAGKYRIGYGTPFDLEELSDSTGINIDSIVYVRIVDVVGSIDPQYGTYDAYGHIVNDPWPTNFAASGFDLTGVGVIYERIDSTIVEDSCIAPTDLAVDSITSNSALLSWTAGGTESAWVVNCNGIDIDVATNPFALTGLTPNTAYTVKVKAVCGEGNESEWSDTVHFTTLDTTPAILYYTVTLTANNPDWGSVYGADTYAEGAEIEIRAVANEGYYFVSWSDSIADSVRTIVVTSDTNLVAIFAENVGIDDVVAAIEGLWPNPTTAYVTVSVRRPVEAVLYDLSGRRVAVYNFTCGDNTIDLTKFEAGVYMLRAEGSVSKIVKR